jgi:acyl carrier protein
VKAPTAGGVSPLLSDAVAQISGASAPACADRTMRLEADLGIDSLALAELVEVISARAGIIIPDEDTGHVETVGDLQDILDAHAPMTAPLADDVGKE